MRELAADMTTGIQRTAGVVLLFFVLACGATDAVVSDGRGQELDPESAKQGWVPRGIEFEGVVYAPADFERVFVDAVVSRGTDQSRARLDAATPIGLRAVSWFMNWMATASLAHDVQLGSKSILIALGSIDDVPLLSGAEVRVELESVDEASDALMEFRAGPQTGQRCRWGQRR